MHKLKRFIGILLALLVLSTTFALAQDDATEEPAAVTDSQPDERFVGAVPSPDFPTGVDWINVDAPLTLEDLRGKVVLLDFWTYGCINCIHMIPILAQLEEKYADELVVIGVHSAKFENEGETTNIRQIVQRYDLHHPVINDSDFAVWDTFGPYGVNAWPTFALIDPRGNILAVQPGEVPFEAFDRVIGGMVEYFDASGEINREPVELSLEGAGLPSTALRFPGMVLADTDGSRLFIADSSNNRYIIADLNTFEVLDTIGSGAQGYEDGDYDTAQFDTPQGMTLSPDGNTLYIADVNNHVIRAVDLAEQTVTTIAGTGIMGRTFVPFDEELPALETTLRSPWDVEMGEDENILYIAMAGTHQIWSMDLSAGTLGPFIGSGIEGLRGGEFRRAELAQPSGLYLSDNILYIADSESSSVRAADLEADEVVTLAGPAQNNLFQFGDVDGETGISRLQHALGVVGVEDGTLYVADTYNSKIKRLDPETMTIETALGEGGVGGYLDGGADFAQFDEPGGIDYANGLLYVADTNNHAIRIIDLDTLEVSTVTFPNPEALQIEG
ncbi:MAG: redoxin domain-containing protein, partial [Burkholderiales bacterium]|nr:redoxin domain-containing protein [Anaerolineae bacterium]